MREIKFRAWDGQEMLPSPQMNDEFGSLNYAILNCIEQGQILMQFTGLKDKNGKEIYEGDVISWKLWSHIDPQFATVEFEDGGFYPFPELNQHDHTTEHTYEVLGNIYENPELAEKGIG